MDGSSDWRFKTHLANLPIYYEYKEDGIDDTDAIKGTYLDNYKNVFDLYITDSTCDGSELSAKTADDSRNEFVNGEAVFYQNGSWEYGELSKTYSDDELAMIPIYFGVDDENEGLATGTENFWCVNKEASEEDIQAGDCVQNTIMHQIEQCDIFILCFTSDNKKSPWLLYEAGYASGLHKRVIPILFDKDSLWHSWIDNPMNVYCSFVALFLSLLS